MLLQALRNRLRYLSRAASQAEQETGKASQHLLALRSGGKQSMQRAVLRPQTALSLSKCSLQHKTHGETCRSDSNNCSSLRPLSSWAAQQSSKPNRRCSTEGTAGSHACPAATKRSPAKVNMKLPCKHIILEVGGGAWQSTSSPEAH